MYTMSFELERLAKPNLDELLKRRIQTTEASKSRRGKRKIRRLVDCELQQPCTYCPKLGDQTV